MYGVPSETWIGMPWKPMWPMSVCSQRIISGRIARPFHAVDCSERL